LSFGNVEALVTEDMKIEDVQKLDKSKNLFAIEVTD
jgi:hypothetical protein